MNITLYNDNLFRTQISHKNKIHIYDLLTGKSLCGLVKTFQIVVFKKVNCLKCLKYPVSYTNP